MRAPPKCQELSVADPVTATALSVFLFVAHVGENNGFPNTRDAAYVCSFDQVKYSIKDAGDIKVYFVPSTDERFVMKAVRIDNDLAGDYSRRAPSVEPRTLSFYAANTVKQSIYFTIDVLDRETGAVVSCDPEVDNEQPS